jgi:PilZ domain
MLFAALPSIMSKGEFLDTERRSRRRLARRLPVGIRTRTGEADLPGHTRDLSTNGIFLYTDSRMTEGSDVDLILILPPELMSGEKCWVCCHARVVRVEEGPGNGFGVAAAIKRMELLPEIPLA